MIDSDRTEERPTVSKAPNRYQMRESEHEEILEVNSQSEDQNDTEPRVSYLTSQKIERKSQVLSYDESEHTEERPSVTKKPWKYSRQMLYQNGKFSKDFASDIDK